MTAAQIGAGIEYFDKVVITGVINSPGLLHTLFYQ